MNADLLASTGAAEYRPLAERMRPQQLDQVCGQRHLLGPGKPLRQALEHQRMHSMILWGPPGVGKTSFARLIAQGCQAAFDSLSAVMAGIKDIKALVAQAQARQAQGQQTIVFID